MSSTAALFMMASVQPGSNTAHGTLLYTASRAGGRILGLTSGSIRMDARREGTRSGDRLVSATPLAAVAPAICMRKTVHRTSKRVIAGPTI